MVIKDGRFGPYVTDGETNASLRKGDDVESITDERASELLADRRARGPAPKKAPAKKAAKKARGQEDGREEGRRQEGLARPIDRLGDVPWRQRGSAVAPAVSARCGRAARRSRRRPSTAPRRRVRR